MHASAGRLARFALVGVTNTLVTLATYTLLLALGVNYLAAGAIGFALGALNGYTWNRVWTFEAGRHRHGMLVRYLIVTLAAIGLTAGLLAFFVEAVGTGKLVAQLLALPVVTVIAYHANHRWTFRDRTDRPTTTRR